MSDNNNNNINILDDEAGDSESSANKNLEFVPAGVIGSIPDAINAGGKLAKTAQTVAQATGKIAQGDIVGGLKDLGEVNAQEVLDDLKTATKPLTAAGGGGGGKPVSTFTVDVGGSGGSFGAEVGYDTNYIQRHRLDVSAHPTEVKLKTGIKVDAFTPDFITTESNYSYPVHYTGAIFNFPSSSDTSIVGNFWNQTIVRELYILIQRNISFSLGNTGLTQAMLTTYMNDLATALQVYYFVTRYLVYMKSLETNMATRNEAFFAIANTITSTVADSYVALRRVLSGMPIPPNLNTFCYYLMQHYVADEQGLSPIFGIVPVQFTDTQIMNWSAINTCITALNTSNNILAASMIGRAIPSWYATSLMTASKSVCCDPNFTTIWCNLPFVLAGTSPTSHNVYGPSVTNDDTRIYYNSYTEILDGAAFAMCGGWTGTAWIPSLMTPVTSTFGTVNSSNRYSWQTNILADNYIFTSATYARDETYISSSVEGSSVRTGIPLGAQRVWGVTPRTIANSATQLLDYLMTWSTIISPKERKFDSPGPFDPSANKFIGEVDRSSSKQGARRKSRGKRKDKGV